MNKYREHLTDIVEWYNDLPDEYRSKRICKSIEALIELVEKTTPKIPLFHSNVEGKDFWYCPTCRGHLANDTEEYLCGDYCPRCGQALDRGEDE